MRNARHTTEGLDARRVSLLGLGGVVKQLEESAYCTVAGCYREAVSIGALCPTHKQRMVRTGVTGTTSETDWVMDSAGAACRVCGRSVYAHGVTEFCQQIVRAS